MSGNIVIQPAFSWVHHHFGAIHPYLPEITASGTDLDGNITITWRTSELPFWMGPPDFDIENFPAPRGHRWLPLPDGTVNDQTPIWASTYEAFGASLKNWAIGAQQHYSFLENLEKGELWRYKFDTWDFLYDRFSINLFAISGDDIVAMGPLPEDDEEFLTQIFAKKTGRRKCALYSLFSYVCERGLLTDISRRYHGWSQRWCTFQLRPYARKERRKRYRTDRPIGSISCIRRRKYLPQVRPCLAVAILHLKRCLDSILRRFW